MKKLILVVAFVFATGSFINAENLEVNDCQECDCAEYAWNEASAAAKNNPQLNNDWDLWEMTNAVYEDCMSQE